MNRQTEEILKALETAQAALKQASEVDEGSFTYKVGDLVRLMGDGWPLEATVEASWTHTTMYGDLQERCAVNLMAEVGGKSVVTGMVKVVSPGKLAYAHLTTALEKFHERKANGAAKREVAEPLQADEVEAIPLADRPVFSVEATARLLGCSEWSVNEACKQDLLASRWFGKKRVIHRAALLRFIDGLRDGSIKMGTRSALTKVAKWPKNVLDEASNGNGAAP